MKYTLKKLAAIGRLYNYSRTKDKDRTDTRFLLSLVEELLYAVSYHRVRVSFEKVENLDKTLKRDRLIKRRKKT